MHAEQQATKYLRYFTTWNVHEVKYRLKVHFTCLRFILIIFLEVSELNLVLYDYSFKVYGDDWRKTYIFIAVEQSIILII